MADSPMEVDVLIADATAPERLAVFWSELLGRPVVGRMGPYVWLRRENGLGLSFQQTSESKSGKNRMHFGITSPNPAAEQRRVETLGGRRLDDPLTGPANQQQRLQDLNRAAHRCPGLQPARPRGPHRLRRPARAHRPLPLGPSRGPADDGSERTERCYGTVLWR
ncbi:VOC family protein [Streptomyces sp. NPDC059479]|uniref:VOC family protein n=1 Tax=Streptomyces sp. NPDC059479 TaxID=3346848 RepID=UPI0036D20020